MKNFKDFANFTEKQLLTQDEYDELSEIVEKYYNDYTVKNTETDIVLEKKKLRLIGCLEIGEKFLNN